MPNAARTRPGESSPSRGSGCGRVDTSTPRARTLSLRYSEASSTTYRDSTLAAKARSASEGKGQVQPSLNTLASGSASATCWKAAPAHTTPTAPPLRTTSL